MAYMRYSISDTAEYGDYTRGPKIIDDHVRQNMKQVLQNIRGGQFAREWILENQAGRPSFNAMRRMEANHMIEKVGGELRGMMPWLKKGKQEAAPAPSQPVASSTYQAPSPAPAAGTAASAIETTPSKPEPPLRPWGDPPASEAPQSPWGGSSGSSYTGGSGYTPADGGANTGDGGVPPTA